MVNVAGCQVLPPSVETSTPATTPPPASVAVPVIVTAAPSWRFAPTAGEVIVELGGAVSVDAVAARQPGHQGRRLRAHVGEQVDRGLLHVGIGRCAARRR